MRWLETLAILKMALVGTCDALVGVPALPTALARDDVANIVKCSDPVIVFFDAVRDNSCDEKISVESVLARAERVRHMCSVAGKIGSLEKRFATFKESFSRSPVLDGFTSVDGIVADYNQSSLDERFRKLSHETLTSLQGFIESLIVERTNNIFDHLANVLQQMQR